MLDDRLNDRIDAQDYPVTAEEFTAAVGGETTPSGEDVATVVQRSGATTIADAHDARLTVLCGLDGSAVGRRRYSDRDPPSVGEDRTPRQSF